MARQVRVEYAGAIYHVMCRGDRREAIFLGDGDREMFLETLAEVCGRTGFRVHSYVLMGNHYHLLLETPAANLVAGMKWFQGTYTQRFNARHRVSGHLFQGRYKAIPMDGDDGDHSGMVSRYIHLNPARAGLLAGEEPQLMAYRWSSFPSFVRSPALEQWLVRSRVFGAVDLPDESARSRRLFGKALERRAREVCGSGAEADEAEWRTVRNGWFLGGSAFRERLEDLGAHVVQGKRRDSYEGGLLETRDRRDADVLLKKGLRVLKLRPADVRALRQSDPQKQGLAWWVKSRTVVGDAWIVDALEMGHRSNVSRAVRAYRNPTDVVRAQIRRQLHACTD